MLHYETHICGKDKDWVIFLHGLGGNSNIWYKQADAYKKQFNLIAMRSRVSAHPCQHRIP